jgi:aminobenzoyl-glutamate utilization protein B
MMGMVAGAAVMAALMAAGGAAQAAAPAALKAQAVKGVEARAKLAQVITDQVFSFGELGFQEVETSKYLTDLLEKNGFTVVRGVAGLPTGWTATWTNGTGGPTIALGSDIDGIPRASQLPGVAYRQPMIEGAPGHGEGHNSGQAVNIVAALAVKELMQQKNIPGTLMLWPGVAEELVAGKAFMVRAGVFKDVDAVLFTHVGSNLEVPWGSPPESTGLVSVKYTFHGESAHAAGAPWRGKSALDGAELMDVAWNMRREHLRPVQRSHNVISYGGDQPNVVPPEATTWYFIREIDFENIKKNYDIANTIAEAAAKATDTTVTRQIVGTAAPRHFNRPIAEAAYANIKQVGLPTWTEEEQTFAKAIQKLTAGKEEGLATKLWEMQPPPEKQESGGTDDIGDISWNMPTITLSFPSNVPNLPGHNWANAMAMATPIAHKGVVAGAKVIAMTTLDLLSDAKLRTAAKAYFTDVQTKDQKYVPMLAATDMPQTQINADIMARYRPEMSKLYYDSTKYPTYLDQLGVKFPQMTKPQ